jgi:hypothetical protein
VNTSLNNIDLSWNGIGAEGASAFVDALKVNTSLTNLNLDNNRIDASDRAPVVDLIARNIRLRRLFIFDARKMLRSLMCSDECGVVWPYLLKYDDLKLLLRLAMLKRFVPSLLPSFGSVDAALRL